MQIISIFILITQILAPTHPLKQEQNISFDNKLRLNSNNSVSALPSFTISSYEAN